MNARGRAAWLYVHVQPTVLVRASHTVNALVFFVPTAASGAAAGHRHPAAVCPRHSAPPLTFGPNLPSLLPPAGGAAVGHPRAAAVLLGGRGG